MEIKLYILCGLIGSGKSTWAREKAKGDKTVIINKDQIRTMLEGEYFFDNEYEQLVKQLAKISIIRALEKGFNVIVDETNITKIKRQIYFGLIKEFSSIIDYNVKVEIMYFPEREKNIENRMKDPKGQSRESWEAVYKGMVSSFEEPTIQELPRNGILTTVYRQKDDSYIYDTIVTPHQV